MRSFTHFLAIRLLLVIQNFERKYFLFYGIHIAQIWTKYIVLLYLYLLMFDGNWIEIKTFMRSLKF